MGGFVIDERGIAENGVSVNNKKKREEKMISTSKGAKLGWMVATTHAVSITMDLQEVRVCDGWKGGKLG